MAIMLRTAFQIYDTKIYITQISQNGTQREPIGNNSALV